MRQIDQNEALGPAEARVESKEFKFESLNQFVKMSRADLDRLYAQSRIGRKPVGNSFGKPVFFAGSGISGFMSVIAKPFWQGKVFSSKDSTLLNKVFGFRSIKADVYEAESWLDGKPATIIDYSNTSFLVKGVRDEVREIAPGVYLGIAFFRTSPKPKFGLYFALDLRHEMN